MAEVCLRIPSVHREHEIVLFIIIIWLKEIRYIALSAPVRFGCLRDIIFW